MYEADLLVVFFQLALALVLGALVGLERSIAGKEAGMRTFALVTIGSCLFVIVGDIVATTYVDTFNFDPMRMAAGIVTGIGFLGAGLIIFQHELKGLTTAAALWVAAAIGISIGYKLFAIAVFTTFLTLFVFVVLWFLEHYIEKQLKKERRK